MKKAPPAQCLRCQSPMEPGFLVDYIDLHSLQVQKWFEGKPDKSFWAGLKIAGRGYYEVRTFRCTKCGYLESYTA